MKELCVFTRGLSRVQLRLIAAYHPCADLTFAFFPAEGELSAASADGRTARVLCPPGGKTGPLSAAHLLRVCRPEAVFVHGTDGREMLPFLAGARLAGISRITACAHAGNGRTSLPAWSFHSAAAADSRLAERMFAGKAAAAPEGILPGSAFDAALREACRAAMGLEGRHVYLQISPFNAAGQYDRTLDLFRRLLRGDAEARLVCVGQGALRSEIVARVEYEGLSGRVLLPGDADNPLPLLMAADALWLPDRGGQGEEVLPSAQAAGLCCFAGEETDRGAALLAEELLPLGRVLETRAFRTPEERKAAGGRALERARKAGRTVEAVGQTLEETAASGRRSESGKL